MGLSNRGAKLRPRDVQDLNQASEELAAAADQIKRMNPTWSPAVIQLLISANNRIVAIQNRGAEAFARYLEKQGAQMPADAPDAEGSTQHPSAGEIAPPGKEEA